MILGAQPGATAEVATARAVLAENSLDTTLLQRQQAQNGSAVERVTAKSVNCFGGIGNDAASRDPADRLTNMPGFARSRSLQARRSSD